MNFRHLCCFPGSFQTDISRQVCGFFDIQAKRRQIEQITFADFLKRVTEINKNVTFILALKIFS